MKADIEDFKTGWYGLTLGVNSEEIDNLISALKQLKESKNHFHYRSDYEGSGGIGDIEIYWKSNESGSNLELDISPAIYPTKNKHKHGVTNTGSGLSMQHFKCLSLDYSN